MKFREGLFALIGLGFMIGTPILLIMRWDNMETNTKMTLGVFLSFLLLVGWIVKSANES